MEGCLIVKCAQCGIFLNTIYFENNQRWSVNVDLIYQLDDALEQHAPYCQQYYQKKLSVEQLQSQF